jgi:CAAX protease family protein
VYILAPKLGLPQPGVIPMLGITVVLCLLIFRLHHIPPREDVRPRTPRQEVKRVLLLFALLSAGIAVVLALAAPQMLFNLPRTNTQLWLMIMIFYPLVSVLPQEFMYRRFFFRRYQDALGGPWTTIALSATLFGYVHLLFGSWISVAMTLLGGTLFAITYHRTRSLLACSVEHALSRAVRLLCVHHRAGAIILLPRCERLRSACPARRQHPGSRDRSDAPD